MAQDFVPAERAGGDTDADDMVHNAAARSMHGASPQSDAVDDVSALSIPPVAPQSGSSQSAAVGSENLSGSPKGQSSTWNGTLPPDSQSGQASQKAQGAAVVLKEAADQDVGTVDDGELDMVATSSAMLAEPPLSVKVLSDLSISITGPTLDSGVVALKLPDDTR